MFSLKTLLLDPLQDLPAERVELAEVDSILYNVYFYPANAGADLAPSRS